MTRAHSFSTFSSVKSFLLPGVGSLITGVDISYAFHVSCHNFLCSERTSMAHVKEEKSMNKQKKLSSPSVTRKIISPVRGTQKFVAPSQAEKEQTTFERIKTIIRNFKLAFYDCKCLPVRYIAILTLIVDIDCRYLTKLLFQLLMLLSSDPLLTSP